MAVWRRACLGDRRAVLALLLTWLAMTVWIGLIACLGFGWRSGGVIAWSISGAAQGIYWVRRRVWDRWIARQGAAGMVALETLLRRRDHPPST